MANLSGRVRAALYSRLSSRFNTLVSSLAASYGVSAFQIDFASAPRSVNFFYGQLDPEDIEDSSVFKYPLLTLYTSSSANQSSQKPATFAGLIMAGIDIHVSWRGGNATINFEAMGDLLEDVMSTIMGDLTQQNWGTNLFYTGKFGLSRLPLRYGAENWTQTLRFTFPFEVIA